MTRTRQQHMAHLAYEAVARVASDQVKVQAQYRRVAETFPALVHTNGLCQAVSFCDIDQERRNRYLEDLAEVIGMSEVNSLQEAAYEADLEDYMHLTWTVMEAAGWLKRHAQAQLAKKETEVQVSVSEETV